METFSVRVYVPQALAVAAGKSRYGEASYSPSDAELAALTPDERAWLGRRGSSDMLTLDAPEPSWDAVAAALRAAMDHHARTRAAARTELLTMTWDRVWYPDGTQQCDSWGTAALGYCSLASLADDPDVTAHLATLRADRIEALVSAALALDPSQWVRHDGRDFALARELTYPGVRTDPRLRDVIAAAEAAVVEARRVRDAARARSEAAEEAAKAEKAALVARAEAEFRAFAVEQDATARAAREGYEVKGAVADMVAAAVAAGFPGAAVLKMGTAEWEAADWGERAAPFGPAFDALDRVTAHVATVARPASLTLDVDRVKRFRSDDDEPWQTVVLVRVESPITPTRVVVVPTEGRR